MSYNPKLCLADLKLNATLAPAPAPASAPSFLLLMHLLLLLSWLVLMTCFGCIFHVSL